MTSWIFFKLYCFKGGFVETIQEASYKLNASKDAPCSIVVIFRVPVRDCLSPGWVGNISLVDFVCMHPSIFPYLPALFSEKAIGENPIDIMEGEVVRLGSILEFFTKGRRISSVETQSLFYLREFT